LVVGEPQRAGRVQRPDSDHPRDRIDQAVQARASDLTTGTAGQYDAVVILTVLLLKWPETALLPPVVVGQLLRLCVLIDRLQIDGYRLH
jgi:hypothetical protein